MTKTRRNEYSSKLISPIFGEIIALIKFGNYSPVPNGLVLIKLWIRNEPWHAIKRFLSEAAEKMDVCLKASFTSCEPRKSKAL